MKRGISLLLCLLLAVGMLCSVTGCKDQEPPRKERKETSAQKAKKEKSAQSDKKNNSGKVKEAQDACKTYYENHFEKDTDIGLCADVTGDQIPELIVVRYTMETEGAIEGTVYTLSGKEMKLIYTKCGSYFHGGGFFSWYLVPNGKDSFYLAEETHAMWTGIGTVTTRVYQLDNEGKETEINCIEFTTDNWDNLEQRDNGEWHIKQSAWDAYGDDVQKMVKGGYVIYSNTSNAGLLTFLSPPEKLYLISTCSKLSATPPPLEDHNTIPEDEPEDTPAVTPASSKKPTSPVDAPHVDTVDAAFWRDAESAIKAWKQYLFTGVSCDLEEIGYHDKDSLNPAGIVSSTIQGEKQESWEMVQMIYSKVYKSSCCESYEEIDAHNAMYFTDNILKGLSSADSDYHYVFETDGEVYVYMGLSKGNVNPYINTTAPTFDFSDPSRPKVRVYSSYEYGHMGYYDFEFVKEDGRYKIDSVDSDNVNWTFFAQLLQDLSQYETVEADLCDFMTLSDSYDDPVWFAVPIESDNADVALVNLTTGEVCEAIDDSRYSTKKLSDYTFAGESFYVPISW